MTDEIIQQVHAAKDAFAAEHGYDLRRMVEALRQTELRLRGEGVVFENGPPEVHPSPPTPGKPTR